MFVLQRKRRWHTVAGYACEMGYQSRWQFASGAETADSSLIGKNQVSFDTTTCLPAHLFWRI
jgi:hypothetical protein